MENSASIVRAIGLEDVGDAHAASGLISVALSSVGRTEQVESVDMFGAHETIVVSPYPQAPPPLQVAPVSDAKLLPPKLGQTMPRAQTPLSESTCTGFRRNSNKVPVSRCKEHGQRHDDNDGFGNPIHRILW